jgi:hypothetical protein
MVAWGCAIHSGSLFHRKANSTSPKTHSMSVGTVAHGVRGGGVDDHAWRSVWLA